MNPASAMRNGFGSRTFRQMVAVVVTGLLLLITGGASVASASSLQSQEYVAASALATTVPHLSNCQELWIEDLRSGSDVLLDDVGAGRVGGPF